MSQFKFEDLSKSINDLCLKMDRIEKLLIERNVEAKLPEDELLTIDQVAKLLKLSQATIYTKVCKNEIPVNKQGKRLYFCKKELLDWVKLGRIKTLTEVQYEVDLKAFESKRHHDL